MQIKRVYEKPSASDGYRILVDRLWPRGISKVNAALDEWNKDIAPTTELRQWFNHEPEKFPEFKKKYLSELKSHKEELKRLKAISEKQNLTLVYSAKDEKYNQAVVLMQALEKL